MNGKEGDHLPVRVPVREEPDVAMARKHARELAHQEGLSRPDTEALATATSELAWNLVVHAKGGDVLLGPVREGARRGVIVVARDAGPGIPDLDRALKGGHSTARGLGLGLSSARRLVDEFEIESAVGEGTTVVLKKWAR